MKNKNLLIDCLIFVLVLMPVYLFSQQESDFYYIRDLQQAYFDANPALKDSAGSGWKDFIRWDLFWRSRVGGNDTTYSPGDMRQYSLALNQYSENKDFYNRATPWAVDWKLIGPPIGIACYSGEPFYSQVMGKITAVYVDRITDPTCNTIYAGAESSGLWKTTNRGLSWENVTDNIPLTCGVFDITGDPDIPNIIYIATGTNAAGIEEYGMGIFRSINGGSTWERIYNSGWYLQSCYRILVDPNNGNHLFALVKDKVERSLDGGLTWETIFGNNVYHLTQDYPYKKKILLDIEVKPGDPNIIYIASTGFEDWTNTGFNRWHTAEIWKTDNGLDGSVFWQRLDSSNFDPPMISKRYELATTPLDSNCVYVVGSDTIFSGASKYVRLYKTSDNGSTWKFRKGSLTQLADEFRLELAVSPTDTMMMYLGGGYGYRIYNSTMNFSKMNTGHVDTRAMILLNGSPVGSHGVNDSLLIGNDGGVSFSANGGTTFENINGDGLIVSQFYGLGMTNSDKDFLCGGTIDNGIFTDTSNFWHQQPGGGDAGHSLVDSRNPKIMYSNIWGSFNLGYGIKRTINAWNNSSTWTPSAYFNNEPSDWNRPIRMHANNYDTLYAGFRNLYRTKNAYDGNNAQWDSISRFVIDHSVASDATLSAIAISPSNDSIVYVAFICPSWVLSSHKKLFKTNNQWANIVEWEDLSDFVGSCLTNTYITDIAISPTNPNKIWLTFSGLATNNKVLRSTDGGKTWEDISKNLSRFPVHCIKVKNNTADGLFIGTDVGVFYTDEAIYDEVGWIPFNKNLPVPIVQDLEINETLNIIRAATFGRGIWEADLNCGEGLNPVTVSSDTMWENGISLDGDLIIEPNVTLTVKGQIAFPPNCKLIVKRGATLILDGGTLTNRCSQMWQGVEVWGDKNLPQTPTANHYQGMVIMQNNALIENARFGITTSRSFPDGTIMWDYTGGIIQASNSVFRNNYKSVQFLDYRFNNISKFVQCTFETTTMLPGTQDYRLRQMVSLYEVDGIEFSGCNFNNIIPYLTASNSLNISSFDRGVAILSMDAGYIIDGYCDQDSCPDSLNQHSLFHGFYYGIRALNSNPTKIVKISDCDFTANMRSVYLSVSDYAEITNNTFSIIVPLPMGNYPDTLYGLYLNNSSQYTVQENNFYSNSGIGVPYSNDIFDGIVVNNSGEEPNEIYNNKFVNIENGIVAQNMNRSRSIQENGLCLKCNDFSQTVYDMVVTSEYVDLPSGIGIALNQGGDTTVQAPAGNTFSLEHNPSGEPYSDIDNEALLINYFYHNVVEGPFRVRPDYYDPASLIRRIAYFAYSKDDACPSKLDSYKNPPDPDSLKIAIGVETAQIEPIIQQLQTFVDGGSTETLNTDVMQSSPSEALEIRAELLSASPYLSDTVMKSAIGKEDVLPNEMVRDILVANPQSAKSDEILTGLNSRFIPMPDSMMAEILSGMNIISAKEALETKISAHSMLKASDFNKLVRYYKTDTINPAASRDSLISLYEHEQSLAMKYRLAFEYLAAQDSVMANSVLQNIPQYYNLDNAGLSLHEDYLSYFNIIKPILIQGQSLRNLSSEQISEIQDLASTSEEPVRSFARNMLMADGTLEYPEKVILPSTLKSSPRNRYVRTGTISPVGYFKIFPNPSKSYVIIEYSLKDKAKSENKATFTVSDMQGKQIDQLVVNKSQDQLLLITQSYKPGNYICTLSIYGKIIESKSFVIIR